MSPADGSVAGWSSDDTVALHSEATAFLAGLRARDLSVNTERAYAGRVALYLSYCAARGLDWADPGFLGLKGFQDWLVTEPLPPRGYRTGAGQRYRSRAAANAVLTAVCEYLKFGAAHGWVPLAAVPVLSEPKFLRHLPPGYDPGKSGQFRAVSARAFRFAVAEEGYQALTPEQIAKMVRLASRSRDKFLIVLLGCTGMRIGEALGLRRQDMHLLASSRALGCEIEGPHVHVRRRRENTNGALAKCPVARTIPATAGLVTFYPCYLHERDKVPEAADCDMVFLDLFRAPLGQPVSYQNAKDMFDRLARAAGFAARPHMLRHSAATGWIRGGVPRDVIQNLLGHVSPSSMQPYLHVSDRDKREAVERVARGRTEDQ